MDFARNEVNAGTLRILDREFFNDGKKLTNEECKDEQPNFGEMGKNLANGISKMLSKPIVTAQQLGYQFLSSDEEIEEEPEVPLQPSNPKSLVESNPKLKSDID